MQTSLLGVLPPAHLPPASSPAGLPVYHEATDTLSPSPSMKPMNMRHWIMKTLDQTLPEVHLSLDLGIMFYPISLFTPSFPPITLTPSHFFGKSGSWSVRNCHVTLFATSQRLSEKCYSQKLMLHLSWLYRECDSIPGY